MNAIKELEPRLTAIVASLGGTLDPRSEGYHWQRTYNLWGLSLMLKPESGNKISAHLCCPFEQNEHWRQATGDRRLTTTLSLTKTDERIAADIDRTLAANARDILPELVRLVRGKRTYEDTRQARLQAGVDAGAKAHREQGNPKLKSISVYADSGYVNGSDAHLDAEFGDDRVTITARTPEQVATLVRLVRVWNRGETVTIK